VLVEGQVEVVPPIPPFRSEDARCTPLHPLVMSMEGRHGRGRSCKIAYVHEIVFLNYLPVTLPARTLPSPFTQKRPSGYSSPQRERSRSLGLSQ
jgi:hypothetical protein